MASIKLNTDDVNINELAATIRQKYGKAKGVYVRADKETIWDPIAQVTAELGAAGFQVNMVTQPEDSSPDGPQVMSPHVDILDQREPLGHSFVGSLAVSRAAGGRRSRASASVQSRNTISTGRPQRRPARSRGRSRRSTASRCRAVTRRKNPVANDTESQVPTSQGSPRQQAARPK